MKIPGRTRAFSAAFVAAIAASALATPAVAAPPTAGPTDGPAPTTRWHQSLSTLASSQLNLVRRNGRVTLADADFHPAAIRADRGYGMEVLPARTLATPTDRISVKVTGAVPAGASATVDVRSRTGSQPWSSWQQATGDVTALPAPASVVQLRVTLWGNAAGRSPSVAGLEVSARTATARSAVAHPAVTALSYRVYATREGLVGGTTANGHVITSNDHFVALPSGKNLSPKGSTQYSVQVCGPARCETAPVWDVGPWNTKDDYWNPSSVRQSWKDLPQGTPEAQAAYTSGYNGGKDQFGRTVANPAGIDLADGTFYNVGLNNNGYVTVTYLWTGGGGTGATGTVSTAGDPLNVRSGPHTTDSVVGSVANGSTISITCQTHGTSVSGTYGTTDIWDKITSPVGYVSDAYVYTGSDGQVAPDC